MPTANYWLIFAAVDSLMIAEMEAGAPLELVPGDESSIKRAFARYVKPEVEDWSPRAREKLRLSLAYFIHKPRILDYRVLANLQHLTIPEALDIQQFFRCLYEVLFPGQPMSEVDLSTIQEDNDIMEINRVMDM